MRLWRPSVPMYKRPNGRNASNREKMTNIIMLMDDLVIFYFAYNLHLILSTPLVLSTKYTHK